MAIQPVQILVDNRFLAEAMLRALRLELGDEAVIRINEAAQSLSGALVVAVPSTCSPATAREIASRGARVLLLSPYLGRNERERYEQAGAEVALMDSRTLVPQVRATLEAAQREGLQPCLGHRSTG